MHMWVISVGRHLSRSLKNLHVPAEDRARDLSIYSLALYHVAIQAGLYRKAVQVYDIPNIYPVTCMGIPTCFLAIFRKRNNVLFDSLTDQALPKWGPH